MIKFLKKYKKHVVGAHFVVFTLFSLNLFLDAKDVILSISSEDQNIVVGSTQKIDVLLSTQIPINAVSLKIDIPKDKIEVISIETDASLFDLWSEEPIIDKDTNTLSLSGGTFKKGGFSGEGKIVSLTIKALSKGSAVLSFKEASVLASDGKGTDVLSKVIDFRYTVQKKPILSPVQEQVIQAQKEEPEPRPSLDLNNDGRINFIDLSIMSAVVLSGYDMRFDLNMDGKVNFSDLSTMMSAVF